MAFWLFIYKQFMFLRFNWIILPAIITAFIGLQWLLLFAAHDPIFPLTVYRSPESPETLQKGCFFDITEGYSQSFYAPNTSQVNSFIDDLCDLNKGIISFQYAELMIKHIEDCKERCMGVYFEMPEENNLTRPITYTIYTNRIKLQSDQKYVTENLQSSYTHSRDFRDFIKLQHSIDMELIAKNSQKHMPDVSVQIASMPSMRGGYFNNEAGITFGFIYPVFFIALLVVTFIVPLVEEKEDGIKEFLAIATPLSYMNGLAYYLVRLIIYVFYVNILLALATFYNATGIIPAIYILILIFFFTLAMMSLSYILSVFFNTVFYAATFSTLMHFVPFAFLLIRGSKLYSMAVHIFSLNAFFEAWETFQLFGNKFDSFNYMNLFEHVAENRLTIFYIYIILLVQCLAYSILYYYLTNLFPGPGGIKKSYLFFLKPKCSDRIDCNEYITSENGSDAIIIQDLEKQFTRSGRKILIADRLNMIIKNKEITVLLGHNGAGKTTTINMIMGLVSKDNGKIIVCSERNASTYRHLIGYCPQHSIYMPYMTCKQHLIFFAKLRGLMHREATMLAKKLLKQLNLVDKANEYGKNLSGGMKRRLSLGIAIAGDTKVAILDEPSSGLDIESRRDLWNVLLELRKTKAILITTHHMEEAEVLGDTICILSNGRLQMTGSPLELKRKLGSGYILKLCTNPNSFNEEECLQYIRTEIPTAEIMSIIPPSILISLPYDYRDKFSELLKRLEDNQQQLGITTISISDTTLEDVFLNSVSKMDEIDGAINCHAQRHHINSRIPYQRLDNHQINNWQQFQAVCYKKFLFIKNKWNLALILIAIPFLMATIAIIWIHTSTTTTFGGGLDLDLNHYTYGCIYINLPNNPHDNIKKLSQFIQQLIQSSQRNIHIEYLDNSFNMENDLIRIMKNDFFTFQQNAIGAIEFKGGAAPDITVLYSENMMHSSAILINLIDNAINIWSRNVNEKFISTIYAPVAIHDSSAASLQLAIYAILMPLGMFMLMFYFAMLPFMEYRSGFKRLQAISLIHYWFSIIFCDLLLLAIICLLLFGYQLIIMPTVLYEQNDLIHITLALFFYGLMYLPLIYCLTNLLTTLSALFICMVILFSISFIPPFVLSTSVGDMLKYDAYIAFLRLLPDFNLVHQLRIINERFVNNHMPNVMQQVRDSLNSRHVLNVNKFYVYVLCTFCLLMLIFIFIVENKKRRQWCTNFFKLNFKRSQITKAEQCPTPDRQKDKWVQEERTIVNKILKDNCEHEYPLIVQNLYKYYTSVPAVCGLNFVVQKKECFGLLGVNGAGKTSTFEMMTANSQITGGTIKIDGIDIKRNELNYRYQFGYCPQNDCLNDFMTAYQTLKYMAQLRCINKKYIHNEILYWLDQLDLNHYEDTQVKHYSGGTKRKLQTAAAMIGSPSLVFLDEPTTGVDPASRRFLWDAMQDYQKRNKTIVLTSHSMDECEHLCNRLAIMTQGQFKCLGHVPELKQLYGTGFTISIKLLVNNKQTNEPNTTDDVVRFISVQLRKQFNSSKLRENHAGILTYFICVNALIKWSEVFRKVEKFFKKTSHIIEEYSVNETTLEDIFLQCENGDSTDLNSPGNGLRSNTISPQPAEDEYNFL